MVGVLLSSDSYVSFSLAGSESPPFFFVPLPATPHRGLLPPTFFSPRSFYCCYHLATGMCACVPSQCCQLELLLERRGILAESRDLRSHLLTSNWFSWGSFHSSQRVAFGSAWKAGLPDGLCLVLLYRELEVCSVLSSSWGEDTVLMLCACLLGCGEIHTWVIVTPQVLNYHQNDETLKKIT